MPTPIYYAYCSDVTHGLTGWTGPTHEGPDAAQQARQDAAVHDREHPHHRASIECEESDGPIVKQPVEGS